MYHAE
jgi:hypothetical protein